MRLSEKLKNGRKARMQNGVLTFCYNKCSRKGMVKIMKKILALVLALAMVAAFVGCNDDVVVETPVDDGSNVDVGDVTDEGEPEESEDVVVRLIEVGLEDEGLLILIAQHDIPPNVTHLYLSSNSLTDISPLASLTSLVELDLSNNQIEDISPLSELTNLRSLTLGEYYGGNEISDLSPLSGLVDLLFLSLEDNLAKDLAPLSGLVNLRDLILKENKITDVSDLFGLTNLEFINLEYNDGISDDDIAKLQDALPNCFIAH